MDQPQGVNMQCSSYGSSSGNYLSSSSGSYHCSSYKSFLDSHQGSGTGSSGVARMSKVREYRMCTCTQCMHNTHLLLGDLGHAHPIENWGGFRPQIPIDLSVLPVASFTGLPCFLFCIQCNTRKQKSLFFASIIIVYWMQTEKQKTGGGLETRLSYLYAHFMSTWNLRLITDMWP